MRQERGKQYEVRCAIRDQYFDTTEVQSLSITTV